MTEQAAADLISVPQGRRGALRHRGDLPARPAHRHRQPQHPAPAARRPQRPAALPVAGLQHRQPQRAVRAGLVAAGARGAPQDRQGHPPLRPGAGHLRARPAPRTSSRCPACGSGAVRYRPRTEAGFARITHVTGASGDYWEVWSTDGLRSRYGTPSTADPPAGWADPAIIADPDPSRTGSSPGCSPRPPTRSATRSSTPTRPTRRAPQRYLSQISYADYGDPASPQYLVTVKFILDPAAARPVLRPPARVRAAHHPARSPPSKPGPRPPPRSWPAGWSSPTPTRPAPRQPTPYPC